MTFVEGDTVLSPPLSDHLARLARLSMADGGRPKLGCLTPEEAAGLPSLRGIVGPRDAVWMRVAQPDPDTPAEILTARMTGVRGVVAVSEQRRHLRSVFDEKVPGEELQHDARLPKRPSA